MTNCETIMLPIMEVEPHQTRDVLRSILHTIVFNRALGCVRPVEMESDLFGISYVQCGDSYVARYIEDKITACSAWMERNPGKLVEVTLSFYEERRKQAWFGRQGDRLNWEQWCIPVAQLGRSAAAAQDDAEPGAQHGAGPGSRRGELEQALEDALTLVVSTVNTKRDHIPPVVNKDVVSFPFEIAFSGNEGACSSFGAVKRMLLQTTPPSLLSN